MNLVETVVENMKSHSKLNETAVSLNELSTKDQQELDTLMKEIGKQKMTPSEWKKFFSKIMADINKIQGK